MESSVVLQLLFNINTYSWFCVTQIQEEIYGVNDKATSLVSGELLGTTLKYETASKLERIHFFDVRPS